MPKAPIKPIISTNCLNPKRNRRKGRKQDITQEKPLGNPKSYQKIFFKATPRVRKEVKVAITPKINPHLIIPPITKPKPDKASFEVFGPDTPNTTIINRR